MHRRVQESQPAEGTVVLWHDEEGWGAVRPDGAGGEAWVHFSNIRDTGSIQLTVGERVRILYETPGQDGYPHRAVWVDRLEGHH